MASKKAKKTFPQQINASELGTFLYCRRAWWYQKNGEKSANQAQMNLGTQLHEEHGKQVMQTGCLQTIAILFLLGATILVLILFLQRIIA